MFTHILVPLDGSALAECVFPHVLAIAPETKARVTLIHVLEHPDNRNGSPPIDPMRWHMQKQEAQTYLENVVRQLKEKGLDTGHVILEGKSAESIIDFAQANSVDLIVLSTHGRTGLSGWNVSSVVQKVLLRAYRSILLVRAYTTDTAAEVKYGRVFVASDCSSRAEYILPFAIGMAQISRSRIIFGTVIQKPGLIQRLPPSEEEVALIDQLTQMNQKNTERYHEQITTQLALKGIEIETHIVVAEHVISALHDLLEEAGSDLVMLVAHGESGERRWPYGSIATSLIAHGTVPLLIIQDLTDNDVLPTPAEQALSESRGH